ncbi:hypothetical protein BGX27_002201 [Mortierella sp. AM989]|nr:hypothetical protein BGX27_002201 [Mortierella sp. AM989]
MPNQDALKEKDVEKHTCYLCRQESKSKAVLRTHESESHDGPRRRIHPLRCQWWPKDFQTRKGLAKHLLSCPGIKELSFSLLCPTCRLMIADVDALSSHTWQCVFWPEDVKSQQEGLREFEAQLIENTRHMATARYAQDLFEPVELRLEGGDKVFGMLLTGGAKRLGDGAMAHVRPLKNRLDDEIEDVELRLALRSRAYCSLVDVEKYRALEDDDPIFTMRFSEHSKQLARKLVKLLIQSGDEVLLCLKAEVYGRYKSEDPHSLDIALPDDKSFKVANQLRDGIHKNALVTSGKVVVGPHNIVFHPHAASHVWLLKDGDKDLSNNVERETRSKFHQDKSYELFAGVHPRFLHYRTIPVTLKTLWEFKSNGKWSGIKLASFVFQQLYSHGKIMKSDVRKWLEEVRRVGKARAETDATEIVGHLDRLVEVMKDEETRPVSEMVSKQLRELAGRLQGDITAINKTTTTVEVVKVIEGLIKGKKNK